MRQLLALYRENPWPLKPVRLGPLPQRATDAMRAIAGDLELRLRLLITEGVTSALEYARSEAVHAGHVRTLRGASYVLHRLEDEGVIRCIGEGRKRGKGNGTRLFVAPGWRPADPEALAVAVELRDGDRLADLVWVPDEPGLVAAAEEPVVEGADEFVVGHGGAPGNVPADASPAGGRETAA